jgi:LmbE family N-acetylglucosaminyl deacetylase
MRRFVRGVQRAGCCPVLLPHHRLEPYGIEVLGVGRRELSDAETKALAACDGTKTAAEVARVAGVSKSWLVQAQDEGLIILWRAPVPKEPPRLAGQPHTIIVSPHPDDAALSCGGRMLSGTGVLVINALSRAAWWRFSRAAGDLEKIQACRAEEEQLVSRLSGAEIRGLDLPEALLRGHSLEGVFSASPGEQDREASEAIGRAVTDLAGRHSLAHWFLPLAVGNHIDHRIARDAALAALQSAGVRPTHLHFYEDLPYAAKLGPAADFSAQVPGLKLNEQTLEIDDVLDWKIELLRAYWSQFTWGSLAELRRYARAVGGEVVWEPAFG